MSRNKEKNNEQVQVEAILARMAEARERRPDLLENEPVATLNSVRVWRHRGVIPFGYVKNFAKHYGLSLDWLYFGQGPQSVSEALKTVMGQEFPPTAEEPLKLATPVLRLTAAGGIAPYNPLIDRELLESKRDGTQYILLPKVAAIASAGNGSWLTSEQIVAYSAWERNWYDRHVGVPPSKAILMEVRGNSMEPDLFDGELVFVDMRANKFKEDAIYVVFIDGALKIKRIRSRIDGSIEIKSSNPVYTPDIVSREFVDSLVVVGSAVRAQSVRRLV